MKRSRTNDQVLQMKHFRTNDKERIIANTDKMEQMIMQKQGKYLQPGCT